MFGFDIAIIGAISTAAVVILGAMTKMAIEVIKALHEARDERAVMKKDSVEAAHEATTAATAAKEIAASGTEDIRNDLQVVVTGLARLDGRFTSLERKVVGLGKSQGDLLDMVVTLDTKVDSHIDDTRKGNSSG